MNTSFYLLSFCAHLVIFGLVGAGGASERTQTIDLKAGWNSVFLEVEPAETDPAKFFSGQPIDIAAHYVPDSKPYDEFITNPEVNLAKGSGWAVWYAKERPEAFLTKLGAIYGRQPYLVHAKSAARWQVTGEVKPCTIKWRPDAYNLAGFGVRETGAPTFAEYFSGSAAHKQQPIYRLVDNHWKKVTDAGAEAMRSGEAFWIFCKGSSEYQGPLGVELPTREGVFLGQEGAKVVLRNQTGHPISATLERVRAGESELPVSILITALGDPEKPLKQVALEKSTSPWTQDFPPLEAGKAIALPFEARTNEMTAPRQSCLFKVTTDLGTECWIPFVGLREDLSK